MISYSEMCEMEKLLTSFFGDGDSAFKRRLFLEFVYNPNEYYKYKKILSLKNDEINAEELEVIMQELYNIVLKQKANAEHEADFEQKWQKVSEMIINFIILESINEWSSITNSIIDDLKNKYKENYLEQVALLDKKYLSEDTKSFLNSEEENDVEQLDDVEKKYIMMKRWQDKLHFTWEKYIGDILWDCEDEYIKNNSIKNIQSNCNIRRMIESEAITLKILNSVCYRIITSEELMILYKCGMRDKIIKLYGGKAYGLAVLKSIGANIPNSWFVSNICNDFSVISNMDTTLKYAVRSSADIEDGKDTSFAGLFDTHLNVEISEIEHSIQIIKESVNNNRVKQYIEIKKQQKPLMAIIIQECIDAKYSGVWLGSSFENGILEWVEGQGDKLVSGLITPNTEIWNNGKCDKAAIRLRELTVGKQLITYQREIDTIADFEWCIYQDKLYMLQYRPVTKLIKQTLTNDVSVRKGVYKGIPASPGVVQGPAKYVGRIENLDKWNDGDILMTWFTDPDWVWLMSKSSGVVTAVGGFLCHAAIIARELGIPCVIGIGPENMKELMDKTQIYVNGTEGIVYEIKKGLTNDNDLC